MSATAIAAVAAGMLVTAIFVPCFAQNAPTSTAAGLGPPAHLRCEYLENPLGIDRTAPRLSWWVVDDRRGAKQTAYQIVVASEAELLKADKGDLWDTGKV